jgi:hypothetical protein
MVPTIQPPIFCDECASLALAILDSAPLCAKCLEKTLEKGAPSLRDRIEPLTFESVECLSSRAPESASADSETF